MRPILPYCREEHRMSIRMLSNFLTENIYFWRKIWIFFLEIFSNVRSKLAVLGALRASVAAGKEATPPGPPTPGHSRSEWHSVAPRSILLSSWIFYHHDTFWRLSREKWFRLRDLLPECPIICTLINIWTWSNGGNWSFFQKRIWLGTSVPSGGGKWQPWISFRDLTRWNSKSSSLLLKKIIGGVRV